MRRIGLAELAAFVAVAEHLSFRVAASRLDVSPSALSHTMRQLEERLGVRLLHRTTRSVALTDAGQRLLERLQPAIEQIDDALEDLGRARDRPCGRLRIHLTHSAVAAVTPMWARFLAAYPEVQLELEVDQAPVDLVAKGFDAGIGPRDHAAADMIAVRVTAPTRLAVVGAPAYFERQPVPRTPDDLAHHRRVQYRWAHDGPVLEWPLARSTTQRMRVEGRVTVNNPYLAIRAALDGLGLACTSEALAEPFLRSGQLVRGLEDWSPSFEGFFLYYPGRRQVPAALRAFIDMTRTVNSPSPAASSLANPFAEPVQGASELRGAA